MYAIPLVVWIYVFLLVIWRHVARNDIMPTSRMCIIQVFDLSYFLYL